MLDPALLTMVLHGSAKTHVASLSPTTAKESIKDHSFHTADTDLMRKMFCSSVLRGWSRYSVSFAQKSHALVHTILPKNQLDSKVLGMGRFSILTLDFCNTMHKDSNDQLMIKDAKEITEKHVFPFIKDKQRTTRRRAKYLKTFFDQHGLGTPTSCGYQFIPPRNEEEHAINEQMHVYLLNDSFGTAVWIRPFWMQSFFGHAFYHQMSVPLVQTGGKLFWSNQTLSTVFCAGTA